MGPVTTDDVRAPARRRPSSAASPGLERKRGARQAPLERIVIEDVRPSTPHGRPAKAVVGELTPVTANVFKEGHDVLAARVLLRRGDEVVGTSPLTDIGNDAWAGAIRPPAPGAYELVVEAWTDRYATWAHKAAIKLAAREDVSTEVAEAVLLLSEAPSGARPPDGAGDGEDQLAKALAALDNGELDDASRINLALSAQVARALAGQLR